METFLGILIIIFIVLPFAWRLLLPAIQKLILRSVENRFRRMAGMPSRKEEKRRQRQERKKRNSPGSSSGVYNDSRRRATRRTEPIIPKDYAEDVEFVEIRSYSETTIISEEKHKDGSKEKIEIESQIEDVEFIEIKNTENE